MQSSPSSAPDASRLGEKLLNSRPRTGPECFCIFVTRAPLDTPSLGSAPMGEPMIRAGLYRFTLPSTRPPAMSPWGIPSVCSGPHTSRWKRSFAATAPPARGMSVDGLL